MSNESSLREEAKKQQRDALKGQPLKKKLSYIFYYYKVHIIVAILVLIAAKSLISNVLNHKTDALSLVLVNSNKEVDYEAYMQEYFESTGLGDRYQMSVDPDYVMMNSNIDYTLEQKFFLATASEQVDVVIAPKSFFDAFAKMGYMKDFSSLLSEEELEAYGDMLHTVMLDDEHGSNEEISGIEVSKVAAIKNGGWFEAVDEEIYFGIPTESKNANQALDFLAYIQK